MCVYSCMRVKGTMWAMCMLGLSIPVGFGGCSAHMAVTAHITPSYIPSYGKVSSKLG